ncbi:MAG TPA: hypothetical protein VGG01_07865 [Xanthobacteraceae bacterium]
MTADAIGPFPTAARMERLPVTRWHHKLPLIGGIISALFSLETAAKMLEEPLGRSFDFNQILICSSRTRDAAIREPQGSGRILDAFPGRFKD